MPLVSVCITTYNHQAFIAQTLKGVFNQKTKYPLEIIIYNDCSTDNSNQIIEKLIANKANVTYVVQKTNQGISKNFFESIVAAKGKYVAVLDGDDYWIDNKKIEKQIDFLETNTEFVGCFTDTLMTHGLDDDDYNNGKLKPKHKRNISLDTLNDGGFWIPTSTFVYKNTCLKRPLPQVSESITMVDIFLFYLIIAEGAVAYIDAITAVYRKHNLGEWSGLDAEKQWQFQTKNFSLMRGYFCDEPIMTSYINDKLNYLEAVKHKKSSPFLKIRNAIKRIYDILRY